MSDRGYIGIILSITALFAAFLTWAHFTELDLVTRGQGRVVALGQNRSVQVASRGTVLDYRVAVGDVLAAGDVIATIDPTEARSQLTEAEARLNTLTVRLGRLGEEMSGERLTRTDMPGADNPLVFAEYELARARRDDLVTRVEALMQSRLQKERALEGVLAEIAGAERAKVLLAQEADQILPLVELGALGVAERFRLEKAEADLVTKAQVLAERKAELTFSLSEKDAEIEAARASYRKTIMDERAEVLGQLAELTERLPALRQRVTQTEVVTPVAGIVNQVFFNMAGAVVAEGEVIAEIVPSEGALQIEAMVLPEDIANVEPGQDARISLTAYNAAKYGTLDGTVLRVSADATFSEEHQARMFVVDASIAGTLTEADGSPVTVLPGMIAQVDIVRGKRTILEYIWNPVTKVRDRAFRE